MGKQKQKDRGQKDRSRGTTNTTAAEGEVGALQKAAAPVLVIVLAIVVAAFAGFGGSSTGSNNPSAVPAPAPAPAPAVVVSAITVVVGSQREGKVGDAASARAVPPQAAAAAATPALARSSAGAAEPQGTPDDGLEWLLFPLNRSTFLQDHWETAPVLVRRRETDPRYYDALQSNLDDIDRLLAVQRRVKHVPLLSNPNTGVSQADCSSVKLGMEDLTPVEPPPPLSNQ